MRRPVKAILGGLMGVITFACGILGPATVPEVGVSTIVAETLNAATIAAPPIPGTAIAPAGLTTTFPGGSIVISTALATGIHSETVPAVVGEQDGPWWELAPEHVRLSLQGYALQGKFHDPVIVVFPAADYAAVNESAAANIKMLQAVLANQVATPDSKNLPHITFFNAGPVFQSQVAVLPFHGGYGIRALTEYAQYAAPVNNSDLFYHFQGLTSDSRKYIVAILPVTAPKLQADSSPSSMPPSGGVAFPDYANPDPTLFEDYYDAVSGILNATPADDFTPSLSSLDALMSSLLVTP